jgi:hypothetical protein
VKSDVFVGWGRSRIVDPVPQGANAPDEVALIGNVNVPRMPAFLSAHPVTRKSVKPPSFAVLAAATVLTGAIAPGKSAPIMIDEARRRLARSAAYDGITNISATYGYYVDDSDAAGWANTMATKGFKETPFSGYHIGRERLIAARVRGKGPGKQAGISYHWLFQPVVLVSDDGRSATGRFRLFQPRTGKMVGKAGDFFGASFWGGMYHDRYVLENGSWKIWELTLDEPFITPVAFNDGIWAKSKDPVRRAPSDGAKGKAGTAKATAKGGGINVDVSLVSIGKREEHFSGGPGETWQWPTILPMWFTYTNPVSGRVPEFHQPDCVPCAQRPDVALSRNGYQEPPDFPEANRSR